MKRSLRYTDDMEIRWHATLLPQKSRQWPIPPMQPRLASGMFFTGFLISGDEWICSALYEGFNIKRAGFPQFPQSSASTVLNIYIPLTKSNLPATKAPNHFPANKECRHYLSYAHFPVSTPSLLAPPAPGQDADLRRATPHTQGQSR